MALPCGQYRRARSSLMTTTGSDPLLVRCGECSSLQKRDLHGLEVVHINRVGHGADGFGLALLLLSLNEDAARSARPERQIGRPGDGLNTGDSRDAILDLAMKGLEPHHVVVLLLRIHHENGEVLVIEAGIDVVGALDGAKKERGGDERYQRKRDLRGEQRLLKACAAAGWSRDMGFLLEALDQACPGGSQCGHNAEDEACGERQKEGKQKDGAVKFGIGKIAGNLRRAERPEETAALVSDAEPGNAAKEAEEHAFGEKLADEASAAGADGETNGDFLPPAHRTRHQQVGNVRAGDEQHQSHDEQQHGAYQRQAALAAGGREQCGGHGLDRSRVPCICVRIFAPQCSGQCFETGIRLGAADSGLEARDPLEEGLSALLQHILELRRQDLLRHGRRKPYIRSEDGADPRNPCGATPTTVNGAPLISRVFPITFSALLKRFFQAP